MAMEKYINDYLLNLGAPQWVSLLGAWAASVVALAAVTFLVGVILQQIIFKIIRAVISKSETQWDDVLFDSKFFGLVGYLTQFVTGLIVFGFIVMQDSAIYQYVRKGLIVAITVSGGALISHLLTNFQKGVQLIHADRKIAVKSYVQVARMVLALVVGILVISTILNQEPWGILSGIGALTAVLLLVFKDALLGFVASLQINSNDMVKIGDWIEIPSQGVDGEVKDISLNVIKIRNWDNTVTTIPTYNLVSGSFKNWRPMSESGGRRIKRSLLIDVNGIRFLDEALMGQLSNIALLQDYFKVKQLEFAQEKVRMGQSDASADARRLTNIGVLRAYAQAYINQHPGVNMEMGRLVKQLEGTGRGIPVEAVFFSKDTSSAGFEALQGDVFDHLIGMLPLFGLRLFQEPTGHDVRPQKT